MPFGVTKHIKKLMRILLVLLCVVVGTLPLTACIFKELSLKELEIKNEEVAPEKGEDQ